MVAHAPRHLGLGRRRLSRLGMGPHQPEQRGALTLASHDAATLPATTAGAAAGAAATATAWSGGWAGQRARGDADH